MSAAPPEKDGIGMLWWAARHPPQDPKVSFGGKTVLITGANIGLGLESAVKFAKLGADSLVLGVRSLQRGEEAKASICSRAGGYDPRKIRLFQLDMSVYSSVDAFAKAVSKDVPRIDVAVLNAGMAAAAYNVSPEGHEMSLQVNVISTALLAILLLPKLSESRAHAGKPANLIFVGSAAHIEVTREQLKLDDIKKGEPVLPKLSSKPFFNAQVQYGVTKLLLMYVMQSLVASNKPGVVITTVCPGLCRSNLGRDFPFLLKIPVGLFQQIFARSSEEGSRTMVSGAALGTEANGEFWTHDTLYRKGKLVTSEEGNELQAKLWAEVLQELRAHVPRVDEILA